MPTKKTPANNAPPAHLVAKAKADAVAPSEDTLEKIRVVLRMTRDQEREVADLEERVKTLKASNLELTQKTLPDMFDAAGIDTLGLVPEGNLPGYDFNLNPYYHANIGTDWEEERRNAAFNHLDSVGSGDLIKSTYTVLLPRGKRALALKVQKALDKLGVEYVANLSVPWNTLTAWVKEQVEKNNTTPPLDILGATVGRVVKMKERK